MAEEETGSVMEELSSAEDYTASVSEGEEFSLDSEEPTEEYTDSASLEAEESLDSEESSLKTD